MTRFGGAVKKIDVRIPGADLPLLSVSQTRGVIRRSELTDLPPRADTLDTYKVCRRNDIVFNKMSIRAGAMGVAAEDGLVTYHYEVMRPHEGADARFIVYLMKSASFIGELIKRERGIGAGGQANVRTTEVPFSVLKTIDAYIPETDEQRAIADYLDAETSQIDALVAKQEEFIGLLQERADAAWTKQMSNAMRESATMPLRRVVTSLVDGPFGSSLTSAHYTDSGTRVIRLGNIGVNAFRHDDQAYISDSYGQQLSGHEVRLGDVVIAGLGDAKWPLGRAAAVPDIGRAIVKADCFRARPAPGISGAYLAWALSAPQTRKQVAMLARGTTRQRINTSIARTIEVPIPPLSIQQSILNESTLERSRIDALVAKAQEHIALAKERRSALITAAVTGQFDVRTAAQKAS